MNLPFKWIRRPIVAVLAIALGAMAFGQDETHLRWSISVGVGSLDPHSIQGSSDRIIVENVFSGLVRHKPGTVTQVAPDLAYHWTVSEDGLTYTFFLRNNAQWHDGYGNVTAADVKYSWERVLDPDNPGSASSTLAVVESIEVLDDYTVQVTLNRTHLPFLIDIAHAAGTYIVNEQAVTDGGDEFRFQPVGSGPFRVVSAVSRGSAELEAFDGYWEGRPRLDRVTMQVVPDETVATLALRSGELDYAIIRDPINIVELLEIEESGGPIQVNMDQNFGDGIFGLFFNTTREPLDNVLVRQALVYALDREALVTRVNEGLITQVAHSILPPSFVGATEEVQVYPHDPDRARELLAEAGYPDGFSVKAMVQNNNPFMVATLPIVQAMWAEVGVELVPEVLERATVRERQSAGDYDITLSSPTRVETNQLLDFFHSANSPRPAFSYYSGVDDLIKAQAETADPNERVRIIQEIQQRVAEDVPIIPLWYPLEITAARDHVKGMIPNLGGWQARFYLFEIRE